MVSCYFNYSFFYTFYKYVAARLVSETYVCGPREKEVEYGWVRRTQPHEPPTSTPLLAQRKNKCPKREILTKSFSTEHPHSNNISFIYIPKISKKLHLLF